MRYDYVFTRSRGAAEPGARRLNADFPARVVKCDDGLCWLREAEIVDEYPGGGTLWRANPQAPCLAYPVANEDAAQILREGRIYPMEIMNVSVNGNGAITGIQSLEEP